MNTLQRCQFVWPLFEWVPFRFSYIQTIRQEFSKNTLISALWGVLIGFWRQVAMMINQGHNSLCRDSQAFCILCEGHAWCGALWGSLRGGPTYSQGGVMPYLPWSLLGVPKDWKVTKFVTRNVSTHVGDYLLFPSPIKRVSILMSWHFIKHSYILFQTVAALFSEALKIGFEKMT